MDRTMSIGHVFGAVGFAGRRTDMNPNRLMIQKKCCLCPNTDERHLIILTTLLRSEEFHKQFCYIFGKKLTPQLTHNLRMCRKCKSKVEKFAMFVSNATAALNTTLSQMPVPPQWQEVEHCFIPAEELDGNECVYNVSRHCVCDADSD